MFNGGHMTTQHKPATALALILPPEAKAEAVQTSLPLSQTRATPMISLSVNPTSMSIS